MTTVGFTVIASTEGRGIIHFTTKSTDLQHVRFNCSHDYLNIHLEIQISRVFFGKKWLKESVWGKKKSIGSLSAGNQNSLILIILCWEDQLIFTSLWFLLKPYPFHDCNFQKQQSLQNDLRATSSKTAQNYRAYFGLHSLDFSYKEIGIYHTSEFPEGVTKYFEKFMIAFHANESRMLKKRSAIITGLQ